MRAINKQDLINYLRKSPENLNFNIFGKMLDDFRNTYEADEQIVNKIKNIIINIIEDGGSISPEDDTITELVDLVTELLPEKMIIKPEGTLEITQNGEYDVMNKAGVNVGVPLPSGTISITENGSNIDVAQYATANVSVDDESATIAGLVDRSITSMVIPDGVTTIGLDAFSKCGYLADVSIPNSVTRISQGAFQHCIALHELVIPDSVIMFQSGTFTGSGLTDIYYTGTQVQWEAIASLSDAGIPQGCTIHYEYTSS